MILGEPIVETYLETGLVPRFPTAFLVGFMIIAAIYIFTGVILDVVTKTRREMKRLAYFRCRAPKAAHDEHKDAKESALLARNSPFLPLLRRRRRGFIADAARAPFIGAWVRHEPASCPHLFLSASAVMLTFVLNKHWTFEGKTDKGWSHLLPPISGFKGRASPVTPRSTPSLILSAPPTFQCALYGSRDRLGRCARGQLWGCQADRFGTRGGDDIAAHTNNGTDAAATLPAHWVVLVLFLALSLRHRPLQRPFGIPKCGTSKTITSTIPSPRSLTVLFDVAPAQPQSYLNPTLDFTASIC